MGSGGWGGNGFYLLEPYFQLLSLSTTLLNRHILNKQDNTINWFKDWKINELED